MDYLYIIIGGSLGALSRYFIGRLFLKTKKTLFPFATFSVNILGAFFLGLLSSNINNENIYTLFGDGFLGAFTTFSTFMYEGFSMFKNNKYLDCIFYISISLVLGIIGYFIGNSF